MLFMHIVQQQLQQQLVAEGQQGIQYAITDEGVQSVHQHLAVATEDADGQEGQITAEVIQADQPSPGIIICIKKNTSSIELITVMFLLFH